MGVAEIESRLKSLSADDLRRLALSSWAAFLAKEEAAPAVNECDEEDPALLAALDEALKKSNQRRLGIAADEVRARVRNWSTG